MEKTIKYAEIKEITYSFTAAEIREALMEKYKITITKEYSFDIFEEYEGEPDRAVLTVSYSTKVQE